MYLLYFYLLSVTFSFPRFVLQFLFSLLELKVLLFVFILSYLVIENSMNPHLRKGLSIIMSSDL